MSVSYNKSLSLSGSDIYNKTYENQSIEILGVATSVIIGTLIGSLFEFGGNKIIDKNKNPYVYIIFLLITIIFIIIPLAIGLFTYQKIRTSKNEIIQKIYN
jgi:hypothetical protein